MAGTQTNMTLAERIYALLAYTSSLTIFVLGGYVVSLMVERAPMSAPWQIVLDCMAIPLLATITCGCGNNRENSGLRAATWGIILPLGIVNPLAWLGLLVIVARTPNTQAMRQHATCD